MSKPKEGFRGRRFSVAPSETRTSWRIQKQVTVSPQRIALEKAYQTDKDELLNITIQTLDQMNQDPMNQFIEKKFDTEDIILAIERNQMKTQGDGIPIDICDLINEKPSAILGSIGKELKKDAMKKRMENNLKAFSGGRHNSLVDSIKKKADASKFRDSNQEVVVGNLLNDEKRDKLLDVSLMREMHMDYLHKKENKLLEQEVNNRKKSRAKNQEAQSEETLVSKHIRKNPFSLHPDKGISNKLYYMDIEKKKKKMAFIRMAMEVNRQRNSLLDRRKTNNDVLDYLLTFQKKENNKKNSKEFICLAMIRRIYIMSSHRDPAKNQNQMNEDEFKEVFKKLKLYPDYISLDKIKEIFLETSQHSGRKTMDTLEFIECMKRASQIIYENIEESESESDNNEAEDMLLFKLYDKFIQKEMPQFTLPHHEKINRPTIQQLIAKQDPVIRFLFTSFTQGNDEELLPFEDSNEPMLSFEKVFEMFSLVGLFPHQCGKLGIRFYFDYTAPTDQGLDYNDFITFLCLIGMDIIDRANKVALHEHLKLRIEGQEIKLPTEPLEMLKIFFQSNKYIGSLGLVKKKIVMNENKHRVMEISAKKTFYNINKFNKSIINYMDSSLMT